MSIAQICKLILPVAMASAMNCPNLLGLTVGKGCTFFAAVKVCTELLSELWPNDAVDEEVSRGVDDQEHVRHKSAKNTPNRKSSKRSVLAEFDGIQDEDLVHVED